MPASLSLLNNVFQVSLLSESYVCAETSGLGVSAAVIDGYQNTPATEYHNGVDVSVMEYEAPELGIARGIYKFRVTAKQEIRAIGLHDAVSELIDADGNVVRSWNNKLDVFSLTLPEATADRNTIIELHGTTKRNARGPIEFVGWRKTVCCSNGVCGQCICPTVTCPEPD